MIPPFRHATPPRQPAARSRAVRMPGAPWTLGHVTNRASLRRTLVAAAGTLAILGGILPLAEPNAVAPAEAAVVAPFASAGREQLAPGVHRDVGGMTTSPSSAQAVQVVEVDPFDPVISFEAALSNDRVTGLERTSRIAARKSWEGHRAVAAINGDVWSGYTASAYHAPNGIHIQDGELMVASSSSPATFGIGPDRRAMLGSVSSTASVTSSTGASYSVARVNQRRRANELVLYTPRFDSSTLTSAGGTEVILSGAMLPITPSGTWTALVDQVRTGKGNSPTAPGTLVLSGTGPAASFLNALLPGEVVTLTTSITPGWEGVTQAISGREWIVRDGSTYVWPRPASANVAHPRSAIGIRADGRVVIATVDGRRPGYSTGVNLVDLAELMKSRGAVQAINLDGGGSTTLAVRQPGDIGVSLVNRPSGATERAVTNSLLVVSSAPTGPIASAIVVRADGSLENRVVEGSVIDFRVKAMDSAFNGVPVSGLGASWWVEGPGTIDATGRFRATGLGTATIVAQAGFVQARRMLTIVPDDIPPVAKAPIYRFDVGAQVAPDAAPIEVRWASASDVGSGVVSYGLRTSRDGSPWTDLELPSPTTKRLDLTVRPGSSQRFAVNATDAVGNVGEYAATSSFRVRLISETGSATRYTGSWRYVTGGDALGSRYRYATRAGAKVRVTVTGSQFAWIAPVGPTFGSARVYVDGRYTRTVSLYRTEAGERQVVWAQAWSTSRKRTIEIRVVGTRGHPAVAIDGALVIDPPPPDPVLLAAGDVARCDSNGDTATSLILNRTGGTIAGLGDLAYPDGSAADFRDCYGPTWGLYRSRTRPVPGNHEYQTPSAADYFAYFGSRAGTPGQGWYAYDLGSWRIYALNSNCDEIGGCGPGSPQEAWLRADLAANPRQCSLAYWHHPLFSSGEHGSDPRMRDVAEALYESGVDVVLSGHDHDYERFALQSPDGEPDPDTGFRQFVVGTGGAPLRGLATVAPNSETRAASTYGLLKLTLRPTSYAWQFLPVAAGGFTETGWTACR